MFSLSDFAYHANSTDFQRSNMFSVFFATAPGEAGKQSSSILKSISDFGADQDGLFGSFVGTGASYASMYAGDMMSKYGANKFLLGASSNRFVETIAGRLGAGGLLDVAKADFKFAGLMAYSVQLPESRIGYEMDRFHNAPNVKIMNRELDPLVIGFRMDGKGKSFKAMLEWNHSVEDPITGLRALPSEVSAEMQVIMYDRNGKPTTIYAFNECMPMTVSSPVLSYEDDNQISTFDVTFAYRSMTIADVPREKAEQFLTDGAGVGLDSLGFGKK